MSRLTSRLCPNNMAESAVYLLSEAHPGMRRGLSSYASSHKATLTGACRDQAALSRSCPYRVIHRHLGPDLKILRVENGSLRALISV